MNYDLAALKLMCSQLKQANQSSQSSFTLGAIRFQRIWFQGVLVSLSDDDEDDDVSPNPNNQHARFLLDDGTGIIELILGTNHLSQTQWQLGMYVMVVGGYIARPGGIPAIRVHKLVDLSAFPDREAMWYLEVIEAFRMFYQTAIDIAAAENLF